MKDLTTAKRYSPAYCNLCYPETVLALYDAKTRQGPWGFLCQAHFDQVGVGLGLGKGQKLIYPKGAPFNPENGS